MEAETRNMTAESGQRVKFESERLGEFEPNGSWRALAAVLCEMERLGYAPTDEQGQVFGNVAMRYGDGLLVSRSGRHAGVPVKEDFVYVAHFNPNPNVWEAKYYTSRGSNPDVKPTSDTPLYWLCLKDFIYPRAKAAVHGHKFPEKMEGIPVSEEETMFSTPGDREALRKLMEQERYPFPQYRLWIRNGHGFFAIGETPKRALDAARGVLSRR